MQISYIIKIHITSHDEKIIYFFLVQNKKGTTHSQIHIMQSGDRLVTGTLDGLIEARRNSIFICVYDVILARKTWKKFVIENMMMSIMERETYTHTQ